MPCSPRALRERLRIRLPLLLAPMAAPAGTPALCAAVANAGGLGSLCGAELPPEALRAAICAVRALTDQPFAVHLRVNDIALVGPKDPQGTDVRRRLTNHDITWVTKDARD